MKPVWEYQYEIDDGPRRGVRATNFYLTDAEAQRWPRMKEALTRRLDETRRDRNKQPAPGYGLGFLMPEKKKDVS